MKLKYYLRGLGIGILVTAAITGISNKNARAEIIKEYEQKIQFENEDNYSTEEELASEADSKETQSFVTEDNRNKEKESEINMAIESALEQEKQGAEGTDSNVQLKSEEYTDKEYLNDEQLVELTIVVEPGDSAGNVAWKLYEAGVIADKEEFIVFLKQNGYDKTIRTGVKKIYMNDDWDTIGKKLTLKEYDVVN